jgi:hypothetical protein
MASLTHDSRYKTYAHENFKKSQPYANGAPMKQAVIAPSMLYLLYPLNGTVEGYPKEQFVEDLVKEVGINLTNPSGQFLGLIFQV